MPHCMVYLHQEHGQHVEAISLQLHQALVDCELFKPESIKVRVLAMQAQAKESLISMWS